MTYYTYCQTATSVIGVIGGAIDSGWHGVWRSTKLTLGNFYFDENNNFLDNIINGVSRHTWEFLQTAIGHGVSQYYNLAGFTTRVDYLGGATFSSFENNDHNKGVTIGNYINVWNSDHISGNFEDYVTKTPIYMHEYGHTFDSRIWGALYLPVIGLHSISDIDDPNCWTEIRANRFAKKYFGEFYGVNWNGIYTKRGMNHVIEDNYHTYIH